MKWLVGIVLGVLVGTVVVTTLGSLVSDGGGVASTTSSAAPLVSSTTTSVSPTGSTAGSSGATTSAPSVASTTTAGIGFTMSQLAQHASSTSCWLLIDGRVYDVTTYLRTHPGGSRTITPWCGKEATQAFETEDGRGEHSSTAVALLDDYLLGPILR